MYNARTIAYKATIKCIDSLYDAGFNQIEIAIGVDVSDRTIRKWECGECIPNFEQYIKLLQFCKDNEVLKHSL